MRHPGAANLWVHRPTLVAQHLDDGSLEGTVWLKAGRRALFRKSAWTLQRKVQVVLGGLDDVAG